MFLSSSFTQWRESFLLRGKKITYTWKKKILIFYCFTHCHTSRKTFFRLVTHVKIPSWKGNFQETTSVKNMFSDFFPSSINWVKKKLGKNKLFIFFFQEKSFLVLVRNWMKKNCFAKKNLFLFNSSQLKKKFLFSFKQEIKVFSWKRNFFPKILFSRVKLS